MISGERWATIAMHPITRQPAGTIMSNNLDKLLWDISHST